MYEITTKVMEWIQQLIQIAADLGLQNKRL